MTIVNRLRQRLHVVDYVALGIVLILLVAYLYNLTGWQIFDDEGEYLYQVWRMLDGETPYRDFLTPQLPLFLYAGKLVMSASGVSLFAMRLYSVLLAFSTASLLYLLGRRHGGPLVGLLALFLFLVHPDVFRETRIFRNEPLFLLFITAGIVAATWPRNGPRRLSLAIAGFCFGLATLAKLFGLLPAGGVGLWLLWDWWSEKRSFRAFLSNALALVLPLVAIVGLVTVGFVLAVPNFLELVLGHHLAQGSQLTFIQVLRNKLGLLGSYFSFYPVLVTVALLSAVLAFKRGDVRRRWALQIPTVIAFLVVSRQFGQRHFMYLIPSLALLAAWSLSTLLRQQKARWARPLGLAALLLIAIPALRANADRAQWRDTETDDVVALIQDRTAPGDTILADDIGLAFYGRRPTTYSGAALSHGAVTSGQITGEGLIREIVQDDVRLVLMDVSLLTGNHLVFLRDYPRFHRFLEDNFRYLGQRRRDYQVIDVWWRPQDSPPFNTADVVNVDYRDGTRFGQNMRLLGYSFATETTQPGDTFNFTLFWQAEEPATNYWSVFTHLVGPDNSLVGQHDKIPYDGLYPPNRWWPDQIVDDDYAISIPEDAPAGEYRIRVGMYDWQTGERLPLWSAAGEPLQNDQVTLEQTVTIEEQTP